MVQMPINKSLNKIIFKNTDWVKREFPTYNINLTDFHNHKYSKLMLNN